MRRVSSSRVPRAALLGSAVAVVLALGGCGGGGSDSTTPGTATGTASLKSFGEEASPAERAAAAQVVEEFFRARRDGDSAKQCSLMSASTKKNLQEFGGGLSERIQPCPKLVKSVDSQLAATTITQPGRIRVISVRVEGERGFVLYRDAKGAEAAFPVIREGSAWKVSALAGSRLQ
jgi:hypothetical protein